MSTIKSPNISIAPVELYSSSSSTGEGTDFGAKVTTGDGRAFRWTKAGGSALVPGKLQQAAAQDTTNQQNLGVSAAAAGTYTVTVTDSVTLAANALTNGVLAVTTGSGVGYLYGIASNTAAAASGFTITLSDPIQVALSTTSKIDVIPNVYSGVIVNPASASSSPVGVAISPIASGSYGWIQTEGAANVLADGAITAGQSVYASSAVAGAVSSATATSFVGIALEGIADTQYGLVKLSL